MSTDEYAWTDEQARKFTAPCVDRWQWDAWLAAHDARVRRDAALTLAEHFSAEAIDQARQGNTDGADFYRAVAAEIEKQTPEEDQT